MPRVTATASPGLVAVARYETVCRAEEFTPVIKADVHDALWFLTQQWRSGEFEGEDASSLVKAKIDTQSIYLNRFKSMDGNVEAFKHEVPLEAKIERLPLIFDLAMQIEIGNMWRKILKKNSLLSVYQYYLTTFPITNYALQLTDTFNVQYKSNESAMQIRKTVVNRIANGGALFDHIYNQHLNLWDSVPNVTPSAQLTTAQQQFKAWLTQAYYWPEDVLDNSWSPQQLEYKFSMSAPDASGSNQTVLFGDQYTNGDVDWFSADRGLPNDKLTESPANSISNTYLTAPFDTEKVIGDPEVYSYLPHTVTFKGMPKGRWWEFEDKNIDIARMAVQQQDITRVVMMEFGLRYSNDYFVIPQRTKVGTLTEVRGLVVTDVFGLKFVIEEADKGISTTQEKKWDMYNNSRKDLSITAEASFNKMLLSPSLINRMESEPLEKVMFVRDEMSNMVWGIEDIVPNDLLSGMNGRTAANNLVDYIGGDYNPTANPNYHPNNITLRYRLINNTVPENWIPFIPAKPDVLYNPQNRAIKLQRATMPRYVVDDDINLKLVRPRTNILSINLPDKPYYINEEEISSSGFSLSTSYQRTRWYNGRTFIWLGRKRQIGKGEVYSGLLFDKVVDKQPELV